MKPLLLTLLVVFLVFSYPVDAQVSIGKDEPKFTSDVGMFYDTTCIGDKCNMVIHSSPQRIYQDGGWQESVLTLYRNGTWVIYTEIDNKTMLTVDYCTKDGCHVCRSVDADKIVPMFKDDREVSRTLYEKGTTYCNMETAEMLKFGEDSTRIQLNVTDGGLDGAVYRLINCVTTSYVSLDTGIADGWLGNWERNVTGQSCIWNYTYVSIYGHDTSPLPDDATIINATWSVNTFSEANFEVEGNYSIEVRICDVGDSIDGTGADWEAVGNGTLQDNGIGQDDGGVNLSQTEGYLLNRTFAGYPGNAEYIEFVVLDNANISKTGNTTVCLKADNETNIPTVSSIDRRFRFTTSEGAANRDPFMTVYYDAAVPGDTTDPIVTLNSPADNANQTAAIVTFNCTASDETNLTNVTLYHNFTSWHANETNSSGINASDYIFTKNFNDGDYVWNCFACDNSTNCAFGTNRTFSVDTVSPDLNFVSPTLANNSLTNNVSWIYWNVSASEALGGCLLDNTTVNQTMTVNGDYCFLNQTGLANLTSQYVIVYGNDTAGNLNVTEARNITINLTDIPPADTTAPDLNFVTPTLANNSLTNNVSWIYVNVSGSEALNGCLLDNTTTNQTMTVAGDYCYLNMTGLANSSSHYFIVYGNDSAGNLNTTEARNITVNLTQTPAPPGDVTPPDVNWIEPVTNGTQPANQTYIFWNISSTENISTGFIEINGTNNTCTIVNDSANSHCGYNQTGLSGSNTHCSVGWAADPSGNTNRTFELICRTTNITAVVVVAPEAGDVFIAFDHMLNYIFLLANEIMEAWYANTVYAEMWFHDDGAGVTTTISTQDVWVQIAGWDGGNDNGQTLRSFTYNSGNLTALEQGRYKIDYSISFGNVGNNQEYQIVIFRNNIILNQTIVHRKIGAAGDVGSAGASAFVDLNVSDIVNLMVRNNDGTANILTHATNVNLLKIGDIP